MDDRSATASDAEGVHPPSHAWGRWGGEDESGALNEVGPEQVLAATGLVRSGVVVSLGQPLGPDTPMAPHRKRPERFMTRDGGDYAAGARRPDGFQFAEDVVSFSTHSATHVDALAHVFSDDQLYNGFPASGTRSTTGAKRCAADKLLPIVTRGVLLDVAAAGEPGAPDDRRPICAADLHAAASGAGVRLGPGDAVLVRTGWMGRAGHDAARYFDSEPGIDESAAAWLSQQRVAVVGADNYAVEVQPSAPGTTFPVHRHLIRDHGIPLIENLVLDELAAHGRSTFLFVAAPLPLVGSTAGPVRPVAVL